MRAPSDIPVSLMIDSSCASGCKFLDGDEREQCKLKDLACILVKLDLQSPALSLVHNGTGSTAKACLRGRQSC